MLLFLILLSTACQRTVSRELPYDKTVAESIRSDLDAFAE